MELQGKVIAAVEQRKGVSARGEWVSQDFVIETQDNYPRKMMFTVFGADRLQRFQIQVGQLVNVSFDINAREWNGRWFNDIRAFDVRQVQPGQPAAADPVPPFGATAAAPAAAAPAQADPFAAAAESTEESQDDLPF